jgi:transcriptional regulator with XRE-family HTH domain
MSDTATELDEAEYFEEVDAEAAEYDAEADAETFEEAEAVAEYEEADEPEPEETYEPEGEADDSDEPGTEVAIVEHDTVEVVPLTEREAQRLDKKIRTASEKVNVTTDALFELLEQAAAGRIHDALGYASWTAWFSEAVSIRPQDRDQRKAFVALMTGRGMSQRAIAGALGVSQKTVDRDLEGVESEDSDTVTGLDNVERPRTKARKEIIDAEVVSVDEEGEVETPRSSVDVIDDFANEIDTLLIGVQAFKDVLDDDLFPKARKRIAQRFTKRLDGAIAELTKVLGEITS